MAPRSTSNSPNGVADELKEAKIKNEDSEEEVWGSITVESAEKKEELETDGPITANMGEPSDLLSPAKKKAETMSPSEMKEEATELVGGDITIKQEPGQPPKLARSSSQKVPARATPLFDHLPDATSEVTKSFQLITNCTYVPKYLGDTEHAMDCDCAEEWGEFAVW
jgi:[histone H3]-lysine36 N-trimethyltransferase